MLLVGNRKLHQGTELKCQLLYSSCRYKFGQMSLLLHASVNVFVIFKVVVITVPASCYSYDG